MTWTDTYLQSQAREVPYSDGFYRSIDLSKSGPDVKPEPVDVSVKEPARPESGQDVSVQTFVGGADATPFVVVSIGIMMLMVIAMAIFIAKMNNV